MEFKTNGNPWIIGYPIHECYSLIEQKVFHLLSIINASEKSNALIDLKQNLVSVYEFSEISRILLECAVQIRNEIDLNQEVCKSLIYSSVSVVGKLFSDLQNNPDNAIDLTFREACNKIIHSRHINFDLENAISLKDYDYLNKIIYLYGDHFNKDWKVELDVIQFVCVLVNII